MSAPELDWNTIISALAGSGLSLSLARAFLSKALKDIDHAIKTLQDLTIQLAMHSTKLEIVDELKIMVSQHDREIIRLKERLHIIGLAPKHIP